MKMKVWQCELFAKQNLTLPCVIFIGKFTNAEAAMEVLLDQLAQVQVFLYPGAMLEAVDDGFFTNAIPFRMTRFAAGNK